MEYLWPFQDTPPATVVQDNPEPAFGGGDLGADLTPDLAWSLQGVLGNSELMCRMDEPVCEDPGWLEPEPEVCAPETDEEAVARVTGDAGGKLNDEGLFDWVSEDEASSALDGILSLKPELQGKVIDQLSADQLNELLAKVPPDQRVKFDTLYKNTTDPDKKLQLWSEYYKSTANNKVDAEQQDVSIWDWSADGKKKHDSNGKWDKIGGTTGTEADQEVAKLQEQIKAGKATMADVDKMIERKNKEQELELKYGIALTNDAGSEGFLGWGKRDGAVWSKDELDKLETTLSRIPASNLHENPGMNEIYRAGKQDDWRGLYEPSKRRVSVSDSGAENIVHDRHDPLTTLLATSAHEIGHAFAEAHPDIYNDFNDAVGWKTIGSQADLKKQLVAAGMPEEEAGKKVEAMFKTKDEGYGTRGTITYGGRTYAIDQYDRGSVLSFKEGAIPDGHAWSYGRGSPDEYWADLYSRCVHQPDTAYDALVSGPKQQTETTKKDLESANKALSDLTTAGASEDQIKAAKDRVDQLNAQLDLAKRTEASRGEQWKIMRERVFKTDDSDIQALTAPAGKEQVYADYKLEAAKCATPIQLQAVRDKYKDKL